MSPSAGDTSSEPAGSPAWVTVTVTLGMVMSVAVTWMEPTLGLSAVFTSWAATIVPELVPDPPDWMASQLSPATTAAVQLTSPVPVLSTEKEVVPAV